MAAYDKIIWIVLDSVGIGELPDAAEYGDVGRNTLGHIAESRALAIPNLVRLGLASIAPLKFQTPPAAPLGAYGKGATHSPRSGAFASPVRPTSRPVSRSPHRGAVRHDERCERQLPQRPIG